jgi:hypothetical protein
VLGYIDGFSPRQKYKMKLLNLYPKLNVRETRFIIEQPEKWNNCQPLLKQIDSLYKKIFQVIIKNRDKKQMKLNLL